jgi:hypothetical protein
MKLSKIPFVRYNAITKNGDNISCMITMDRKVGIIEVFNNLGEKIAETKIDFKPMSVNDITESLSDVGIDI